jgi:hypothetical protein
MPPIKLSHALKHQNKTLIFSRFGNENHLVESKKKEI